MTKAKRTGRGAKNNTSEEHNVHKVVSGVSLDNLLVERREEEDEQTQMSRSSSSNSVVLDTRKKVTPPSVGDIPSIGGDTAPWAGTQVPKDAEKEGEIPTSAPEKEEKQKEEAGSARFSLLGKRSYTNGRREAEDNGKEAEYHAKVLDTFLSPPKTPAKVPDLTNEQMVKIVNINDEIALLKKRKDLLERLASDPEACTDLDKTLEKLEETKKKIEKLEEEKKSATKKASMPAVDAKVLDALHYRIAAKEREIAEVEDLCAKKRVELAKLKAEAAEIQIGAPCIPETIISSLREPILPKPASGKKSEKKKNGEEKKGEEVKDNAKEPKEKKPKIYKPETIARRGLANADKEYEKAQNALDTARKMVAKYKRMLQGKVTAENRIRYAEQLRNREETCKVKRATKRTSEAILMACLRECKGLGVEFEKTDTIKFVLNKMKRLDKGESQDQLQAEEEAQEEAEAAKTLAAMGDLNGEEDADHNMEADKDSEADKEADNDL